MACCKQTAVGLINRKGLRLAISVKRILSKSISTSLNTPLGSSSSNEILSFSCEEELKCFVFLGYDRVTTIANVRDVKTPVGSFIN